jgi:hypothetical protein
MLPNIYKLKEYPSKSRQSEYLREKKKFLPNSIIAPFQSKF